MLPLEKIKRLCEHIKANDHRFRPIIAVSHENVLWSAVSKSRQVLQWPAIIVDINKTPEEIQADVEAGIMFDGVFRD